MFSFSQFRSLSVLALGTALVLTSGCATMGRNRDDAAVAKVKKAAVAAFVVKSTASKRIGTSLNSGKSSVAMGGSSFYQKSPQADLIFADFVPAFTKASRFSIVPVNYMKDNTIYSEKIKPMMNVVQVRDLPPAGQNWYLIDKVAAPQALELMDRNGRNQLMAGLGVDALVAVEVSAEFAGGFKFLGFGNKPQSTMRFKVYTRDIDEPIWSEWIQGEKAKSDAGFAGFMSEEQMLVMARESAQDAFSKIGTEIK